MVGADSLNIGHQIEALKAFLSPADSLTFFVRVVNVHQTDCPVLEQKNKELHKKKNTWQIIAGVFFTIATGHLLLTGVE